MRAIGRSSELNGTEWHAGKLVSNNTLKILTSNPTPCNPYARFGFAVALMELPEIIDEIRTNLVVPLWPHAGKALGLSRGSTYAAAERGEIPTIKIGRLLRVPVRALERLLDRADRSRVETN